MQSKILSVNKIVEGIKSKYPGAKSITLFINQRHIKRSKCGSWFTPPLAVRVDKKQYDVNDVCEMLGIEGLLFDIKQSWLTYMEMRKQYTYWAIVIDAVTTKAYKGHAYHPTSIYCLDKDTISKLNLLKAKLFVLDDEDNSESDDDDDNIDLGADINDDNEK